MPQSRDQRTNRLDYRAAGVDIDAGNALVERIKPLAHATARKGSKAALGGFGGLFDLKACGYRDPLLVAANDGVGTKLRLAIDTGRHDTVGIDLVAMSVNDLVVQGAEPLFFLDYFACGRLDIETAASVVSGIAEGCRQAGCALIGGETAEMPGMYAQGDYDLAGFAVGAVERRDVLPKRTVRPGDVVLGLASSGPHSNGYSLIRRVVQVSGLALADPAPFARETSLGAALLTPTRIYVRTILKALRSRGKIKGLAHITGGGFTENIPRILPHGCAADLDLAVIDVPAVFAWLAEAGGIGHDDMLRTFNCGIGMVAVVPARKADDVVLALAEAGETVVRMGEIVERREHGDPPVRYRSRLRLRR